MTIPGPAGPAGIIAQQIRETAPDGKDSASSAAPTNREPFIPDLCSVTSLAVLVLMGELLALVLVLAVDGLRDFSWQRLGLISLTVQWAILPSAAILCRLRPRLARMPVRAAGALSYTVVLAVLLGVTALEQAWLAYVAQVSLDLWRLGGNFLLGAICAGVVLRYAYVQQQLRNQQRAELGARIDALQSRIRPHFLFNSMNSVASLISVDPERAERLVEDLCALFRASLADARLVPLEQEVALAQRYLQIEALRLGARLQQDWQVEAEVGRMAVPSMLLQPLLENAVLHGVARLRGGGTIRVSIEVVGNAVSIVVENPLPEAAPVNETTDSVRGNGIALENIRQRLAAHYAQGAKFEAVAGAGRYRVHIVLPAQPIASGKAEPLTEEPLPTATAPLRPEG